VELNFSNSTSICPQTYTLIYLKGTLFSIFLHTTLLAENRSL
jgi:hypothetical protein